MYGTTSGNDNNNKDNLSKISMVTQDRPSIAAVSDEHTPREGDDDHMNQQPNHPNDTTKLIKSDSEGAGDDHSHGDGAAKPPANIVDRALNWMLPPGSIPSSSFNLCAATLGAGTLGLPYAMYHTGALIGSITLVLCGIATVYTIDLLIRTLERTGFNTYEALSRHLVGPKFEKAVAFLIVAFCWGVACVYVVVIGTITKPMQTLSWVPQGDWGNRLMSFIFWILFMLPLSNLRDINSLRYASLVGFLATCYLVLAIVLYAALQDENARKNVDLAHAADFNFWSSLTVFSFSYCCQTNAFEIYHELKQASPGRMKKAAVLGMTFCTALYVISGCAGLAAFGSGIESNILSNFHDPQNTGYVVLAFVAITFTVTLAFPVAIFPTRDAILQVLGYKNAYVTPNRVRYLVCTLLAFSALLLGLFVPNVQILFSILGGVCGSSLGYCLPVFFAWKAGVISWSETKFHFIVSWFIFAVGAVFGTLGTLTTIIGLFQSSNNNNNNNPTNSTGNYTNVSAFDEFGFY